MRVDGIEQRDMMLELDPGTYFITDHYKNWPVILVRMAKINVSELKFMLERRWRQIAPKKLVREADGETKPAKKKVTKTPAKPAAKRKTKAKKAR